MYFKLSHFGHYITSNQTVYNKKPRELIYIFFDKLKLFKNYIVFLSLWNYIYK